MLTFARSKFEPRIPEARTPGCIITIPEILVEGVSRGQEVTQGRTVGFTNRTGFSEARFIKHRSRLTRVTKTFKNGLDDVQRIFCENTQWPCHLSPHRLPMGALHPGTWPTLGRPAPGPTRSIPATRSRFFSSVSFLRKVLRKHLRQMRDTRCTGEI